MSRAIESTSASSFDGIFNQELEASSTDPIIGPLLKEFLRNLELRIAKLIICISEQDLEGALKLTHLIRGSAGMYGFKSIGKCVTQIEDSLSKNANREVSTLGAADIQQQLRALSDLFKKIKKSTQPGHGCCLLNNQDSKARTESKEASC
jgi:HPt (histidine-containing phosphotransfer) domain-containing protein